MDIPELNWDHWVLWDEIRFVVEGIQIRCVRGGIECETQKLQQK